MNPLICATIAFALLGHTDIPSCAESAVRRSMGAFTVYHSEQVASASYHRGVRDGWAAGWKHVRGQYSMPPMAPLAPIPRLGEDNYQGGYNRGFAMGLDRARRAR